jgi:hypothetical protein
LTTGNNLFKLLNTNTSIIGNYKVSISTDSQKYVIAKTPLNLIEGYKTATKSNKKYICHHLEEIKTKDGKYIISIEELNKTPIENIIHKTSKDLMFSNQYYGLPPEKLLFMRYDIHNDLHRAVERLMKKVKGTAKIQAPKYKTKTYSVVGKTKTILNHFNNNITKEQLEKEKKFYYRNR